jgi:hypothetical protein
MSNFIVYKLTGIACKSQLVSCSSAEPDAWVTFADHCKEVAFLKSEVERLKNNVAYLDKKLDEELGGDDNARDHEAF